MNNSENRKTELKEEIIEIKGMSCNSCANLIESKINQLKGVENIRVSLIENKAFVKFNPNEINSDKIKSEINSLGYSTDCNKEEHATVPEEPPIESENITESVAESEIPEEPERNTTESENITPAEKNKNNILQGIIYGLIPHIGCIAFIIGSIFGVTVLMKFFKPLLMNPYFFHILILISLMFATLSSFLYLRKNGLLSLAGMKRKWKYLTTMYGSTIGINLLLFMVIFPLLANVSVSPSVTGAVVGLGYENDDISSIKLKVDIPCSGHAPLISEELKSINGLIGVQFSFPNIFDVKYDSSKTSKQEILALEVFKTYKATVLDSSAGQANQQDTRIINQSTTTGGAGGCCGGGGSCGGTDSGCGCGGRR